MQNSENCAQRDLLKILEQYRQKAHRKVSGGGGGGRGLKKTKFMSVFFQKPRESCNIRHVLYVFFAQLKIAMLKRISVRLFLFSGAEQLQKAKVLIADADV